MKIDKDLQFGNGISVVIPDADFSEHELGQVGFLEELSDSAINYGKAIILPENFDFKNTKNLGKVTFAEELPVTKLNIYCKNTTVVGRGTVLYPVYFPKGSKHLGVKWSIYSGHNNAYIKTFNINAITEFSDEAHDISLACYVSIKKHTVNQPVIIQCTCTDPDNGWMHKFILLTVTYNDTVQTDECALIDIENNTGTNKESVSDDHIDLKVKFYPPNTIHRSWDFNTIIKDYIVDTVKKPEDISADASEEDIKKYNEATDKYDEYMRKLMKYKIINDLYSGYEIQYNIYDKEDNSYYDIVKFNMPRFWQKDIFFTADFNYNEDNDLIGHSFSQRIKFGIDFDTPLYQDLDLDLKDSLGYVPVSSTKVFSYCEISHGLTSVIKTDFITRRYFNNPAIGPKIITSKVYTPLDLAMSYGYTDDIIVIKYIVQGFDGLDIYDLPNVNFLITKYAQIIYNIETKSFYIIYDNNVYNYTNSLQYITDSTKAYYNGSIYSITCNDGKYELILLNTDDVRIHRGNIDIGYLSPNHDIQNSELFNIFKTRNENFYSKTVQKASENDIINIISKSANLLGYDWDLVNIQLCNNNIKDVRCANALSTFGNYQAYEENKYKTVFNINKNIIEQQDSIHVQTDNDCIYINYSGSYGEYEDIRKYKDSSQLKKAISYGNIEANINYGKMYNFIVYTMDKLALYTYYKDYPQSFEDLIKMRAVAEIDLRKNMIGEIVNAGWGNNVVISK